MSTAITMKIAALIIFVGVLTGCKGKTPLLIGFSGELTGKNGDLGVQARDGAQLAVETINVRGGINGRQLELVVRDDKGTAEGAQAADQELVQAGVLAIIGHITSAQTLAAYSISKDAGIVLCSPTASTPELSGREDHFFRVVAPNPKEGEILARYFFKERQMSRVAVIYDSDNAAFTQSLLASFTQHYQTLGGEIASAVSLSSSSKPDFALLVEELRRSEPAGLLIITAAVDVALIAQQARLSEWRLPLVATAWAQNEELIHKGGQAVEGLVIPLSYDPNNASPVYQDFKTRYHERFGHDPTLYADHAYDVGFLLAEALKRTHGRAEGLAKALIENPGFQGLGGLIKFDRYGEVERDWFLLTVQSGKFITTGKLSAP
jgi:branched-chain amino acid transport system substrate-binding protein